jgi:hypothetical protein
MKIISKPIKYNFWRGRSQKVVGIVIHTEVGTQAGSYAWFNNPKAYASAHYNIGLNGSIWQHVSENDRSWHAGNKYGVTSKLVKSKGGNPNDYLIGIEHEDRGNWRDAKRTSAMYEASGWLVAQIQKRYKFSLDRVRIIGHREIDSRKGCPGGLDLNKIIAIAKKYLKPPPPPPPKPKPVPPPPPPPKPPEISIFDKIVKQSGNVTLYSDVSLIELPSNAVVKILRKGTVITISGLYNNQYYISKWSYENKVPNFFDKKATIAPPVIPPVVVPIPPQPIELPPSIPEPIPEPINIPIDPNKPTEPDPTGQPYKAEALIEIISNLIENIWRFLNRKIF